MRILRFLPVVLAIVPLGTLIKPWGHTAQLVGLGVQVTSLVAMIVFRKRIFGL